MIRGWRNDPRWIEFYAKRDHDRIAREIRRIKFEQALAMDKIEAEATARRIKAGRPTAWDRGYF